MSAFVDVQPTYGWGWSVGGSTMETPAPFQVRLAHDAKVLSGKVEGSHPFSGWQCLLSQRHASWDGQVNVELNDAGIRINGYAEVPVETLK